MNAIFVPFVTPVKLFRKVIVSGVKVINSSTFPDTSSSDIISYPSWIKHYSKIFSKINNAVHKRFSRLLEKNLPSRLYQRHVIPVEKWAIVKGIKGLKSILWILMGLVF